MIQKPGSHAWKLAPGFMASRLIMPRRFSGSPATLCRQNWEILRWVADCETRCHHASWFPGFSSMIPPTLTVHAQEKSRTGIIGLDEILRGGLPANRFYLLRGEP